MPPPRSQKETEQEARLQEGCHQLAREKRNGLKINIKTKASELNVPYSSLYGHFHNIHKPHAEAHAHQQFLSDFLERVLVLWIKHLGSTGFPPCKQAIKARAQQLHPSNKKPSPTGSTHSFGAIPTLFYPHQAVLILNGLKPSIR
jgi:hypothetical protein